MATFVGWFVVSVLFFGFGPWRCAGEVETEVGGYGEDLREFSRVPSFFFTRVSQIEMSVVWSGLYDGDCPRFPL